MNKNFLWAAVLLLGFTACNNETKEQKTEAAASAADIELPVQLSYRGKSEIGSNENMLVVMNWNRLLGERKLDSAFLLLADSVTVHMYDGVTISSTRDSMKTIMTGFLASMKSISIKYVSALPINVDLGNNVKHEWVLNWTDEEYTYNDGKIDHNIIHEDYRLENGKIREVMQYARKVAPPAAPPSK